MITRKTKIFAGVSALLFVGSLISVFFIWQYVQREGEHLLQQTKEIADFKAREDVYRGLENLVGDTQSDRNELSTYLLTEEKTIDFLAAIEQVAIEQGVELTTDSLQVEEETGLFDSLVVSYSINGTKEHVAAMLLLLETLPYHASISSLALHFSSENGIAETKGSIKLSVSLLNYDR